MVKIGILELLILFLFKDINGLKEETIKIKFKTLKFSDEKIRNLFNINNNLNNNDYTSYEEKYFYYDLILNNIYSEILIGSHAQKIIGFYSGKSDIFSLTNDNCFIRSSNYDRMISNTFNNISDFNICYKEYENCCFAQEKFEFESYDNNKNIFNNLKFFLTNDKGKNKNICALIGLRLNYQDMFIENPKNFIYYIIQYYNNNIKKLNSFYWTFNYQNNNEGYLSIGDPPHIYDSLNYKNKKFNEFNIQARYSTLNWAIQFKQIFLNKGNENIFLKKYSEGHNCVFYPELNIILSTIDYFNLIKKNFFTKFFKENICFIKNAFISDINSTIIKGLSGEYILFYCDRNKIREYDINKFYNEFPTLNFYFNLFNYNFTLNASDLFYEDEINNKIFFLIGNKKNEVDQWIFGKIFMKKFQFVFNTEMKTLGYYTENNKNNNIKRRYLNNINYKNILVLIIVVILFMFVVGFFVYKYRKGFFKEGNNIALEMELIKK